MRLANSKEDIKIELLIIPEHNAGNIDHNM